MVQTVRTYLKLDESEKNEDYENLSFLTEELEDSKDSVNGRISKLSEVHKKL